MPESSAESGSGSGADARWVPLESSPRVLSRYLQLLGVSGVRAVDVVALEPDALAWVEGPVRALLLLFPCTPAYELHKAQQQLQLETQTSPPGLHFMRQSAANACATVALVHAAANWAARPALRAPGGVLQLYLAAARGLEPARAGQLLEAEPAVRAAHRQLAAAGLDERQLADISSDHHYVALVPYQGRLYELDGRKVGPVDHGPTDDDRFLADAARVCRAFMDRDPDNVDFNVIALTEAPDS